MHDLIIVGVPLLAIFAGILFNRSDVKELRAEMRQGFNDQRTGVRQDITAVRQEVQELRSEMNGRFNAIDAELRYFHGFMGQAGRPH